MKIIKKILIIFLIIIIIVLATGYIYEKQYISENEKTYKSVGSLYSVRNKNMHIYAGGSGDVTVVFAAGWGTVNPYVDFYPLYSGVSKNAKFAVYDRFGYGYSDYTDEPRDIDTIVEEVHELLIKSGQKPPYIFVGHSLGSLEVLRFAQKYGDEVKGVILIDGGNPEYYEKTKPVTLISLLQRQLVKFGMARVLYNNVSSVNSLNSERNELKLLSNELRELDKKSTLLKSNNINITDEMRRSQENAKKVVEGGYIGKIPLTIITADNFGNIAGKWLESQQNLTKWSSKSKQFIVKDASHYIHQYTPKTIINEINDMVD